MCWLESAAHVGEIVGGFATLLGLIFAFVSVDRWRKDRLDERRGDAAAKVLVSLTGACGRMQGRCVLLREQASVTDEFVVEAAREVLALYERLEPKITDEMIHGIQETLVASVALLDEPETAALRDAQEATNLFQNEMNGRLARLGVLRDRDAVARALGEMRDAMNRRVEEFAGIERRGKEILLPIARLRAHRR